MWRRPVKEELLHIRQSHSLRVPCDPCGSGCFPCQLEFPLTGFAWGLNVARKKKVKRFRAVTAVKELARERVGSPPAEKIVVEKKKKPEKHKPTLRKLLEESE